MSASCHDPAKAVSQFLVSRGVLAFPGGGSTIPDPPGWGVTAGKMPAGKEQDRWVAVFNSGGFRDGRDMRVGRPVVFPEIQVRGRGKTDSEVLLKLFDLCAVLDALIVPEVVTVDGVAYKLSSVSRQGDPVFLLQEPQNERRHHVFTARVTIIPD